MWLKRSNFQNSMAQFDSVMYEDVIRDWRQLELLFKGYFWNVKHSALQKISLSWCQKVNSKEINILENAHFVN